jgi:hypothetical protein
MSPSNTNEVRRCWNDNTIREMFKDKFVYAADLFVDYILSPRKVTQSCQLSSDALIRATINFPEDPNTVYARFRSADADLWDDETRPGGEGILWVQALEESASQRSRTKKRPRQDAGDDSDENDGMQIALRRRR